MLKNLLVLFGLFDLISFFRTFNIGFKLLNGTLKVEGLPILAYLLPMFEAALIATLLISGILSILKRKSSIILYYVQFPFKIAFMVLTFGFFLKIFGLPYNSISYLVIVIVVHFIEIIRLALTIQIHRKFYRAK